MSVAGIQNNTALQNYGYMPNPQQSESTQDMFLNLLVTQMTNQNPLEPMDNDSFIQQMAQFASVEQIEQLNSKISQLVTMEEIVAGQNAFTQAASLVGKTIEYLDGEGNVLTGRVDSVRLDGNGLMVHVGDAEVPMNMVTGIIADGDPAVTTSTTNNENEPTAEEAGLEEEEES